MTSSALTLTLAVVMAGGQAGNSGSIEGTIRDVLGAAVPGVHVKARDLQTSALFNSSSDDRGRFVFLVLPAGTYDVEADHPGFAGFLQQDVLVAVGAKVSLAITLRVRGREEAVTVKGETPMIETTRTSFSSTVDARSVASLPLNGRNVLNFVLLTPGITSAGAGWSGGFFSAGGQSSMNSLLIDGVDHNGFSAAPVGTAASDRYVFSQEAVQEFQVNTNSYSAEFGRAGTAVVNVITKSGTNQLRGSAFWYYRGQALSATGYIEKLTGKAKEPFYAHQFGGAAGGPLARDRLFFYASYDGQRRSEPNLTVLNLPSTFTLSANPTVAGFQQLALDYLGARADSYMRTFDQNVILSKLDWRTSNRHSLGAQWNRHRLTAPNFASGGPQQALEHSGSDGQVADTLAGSLTSVLSSATVNVARASFVSTHSPQEGNSSNPEAIVVEGGQQVLQVGRLSRLQDNGVQRMELADTLSLNHGGHTPKVGGSILVERGRFFSTVNFFGAYRFDSLESFGRSLAGVPRPQSKERFIQAFSGQGKPPIDVRPSYVELAAFAQDTWRVWPGFTVDLGLRYDVQVMAQSNVLNRAPALLAAGVDTSFIPIDSNNLAPRAGFAWSPGRSGRLVLRGGYGLFFPRFLGATAARALFQNGITTQTRTFTGASIPAYPNTMCGAPDPSGTLPACAAPAAGDDIIMAISRTYQQSRIQQGSLGVEYAFRKDLSVSVSYLRVKGDHLMHWQDINLPQPEIKPIAVAGTTTMLTYRQYSQPRPIAGFDRVFLLNTNGSSSYHALALQVNKRWSRDFQFSAAYTLANVIDDNPTLGAMNPGPGDADLLSDSLDPRLDRGAGDFAQRHRFVMSGVWELNYAKDLPQPARAILNDWELSGIVTASSGGPYSALVNVDLNNDGNAATDRPPGVGRNTFFLPAFVSVDPRVTRKFRLTRRVVMQVSVDAFNVFNRVNISAVRTTQFSVSPSTCDVAGIPCLVRQTSGATAFGTPTMAFDPRMIQLSVRLGF